MKKCIHPIKARRAMKKFISDATSITYEEFDPEAEPILIEAFGEDFALPATKETKVGIKLVIEKGFCAYVGEYNVFTADFIKIGIDSTINKDYSFCNNFGIKQVRADAIYRYPHLKGFSILTFVLLHELGHFETDEEDEKAKGKYDQACRDLVKKHIPRKYWNYFHVSDNRERLATKWAAEWLKNPENAKRAKQFEKEFFACYEDE